MRFLITGASGFVGRPLCEELFHRDYQVRAAMRSRGQLSAAGQTDWSALLNGVDAVIHLAARVRVMKDTAQYS